MNKHTPVYLQEVIRTLDVPTGALVVDATLGEGGYTQALLEQGAHVIGIDLDARQVEKAQQQFSSYADRFVAVQANFADLADVVARHAHQPIYAVVFDLGLSYTQMMEHGKGLSYQILQDPLDMRLQDSTDAMTAAQVLNTYSQQQLYDVFAKYAEELRADELASAVVARRHTRKYTIVSDLVSTVQYVLGGAKSTLARVFQALRIVVNDELKSVERGVIAAIENVQAGGRVVVVTFHSLEDRVVKRTFAAHARIAKHDSFKKKHPLSFERSATLRYAVISS